jgi:exonuclease III
MSRDVKVLTFNVNGLRSICACSGGLQKFLETLNAGMCLLFFQSPQMYFNFFSDGDTSLLQYSADIVCFQEHKIPRPDFDTSLALAEGW